VSGPGDATDATLLGTAYDVGEGLAAAGYVVVTGGLGGVMAAAARGAKAAGGHVVGLLPGTDPAMANEWVDVAIPTGLGQMRNVLVAQANALVAVGGSWGTLTEIAFARRLGRPVVTVHGWQLSGPDPDAAPVVADDAAAAVREVQRLLAP
jgi:uncharacterized protein (TIGR00725 family)